MYQSVNVDEVKEIDFPEIKGHIERGESVFITRLGTRREATNHGGQIARELKSCVEVPLPRQNEDSTILHPVVGV